MNREKNVNFDFFNSFFPRAFLRKRKKEKKKGKKPPWGANEKEREETQPLMQFELQNIRREAKRLRKKKLWRT